MERGMDLVKADGSAIKVGEGQKLQLGRTSGHSRRDESVSRVHIVVELLRPPSIKGKEVVGKSVAPKLHVEVLGRNPICIISTQGKNSPTVKFAGRGEKHWLAPGDKLSLSIKQPFFYSLRQCSLGTMRDDSQNPSLMHRSPENPGSRSTFQGGVRTDDSQNPPPSAKDLESYLSSQPSNKDPVTGKWSSLEEEEGIANAVARRQKRRLERDKDVIRKRESEQEQQRQQLQRGERPQETLALATQAKTDSSSIDPVSEFGFVVKGSEFLPYTNQKQTVWSWKIDKKRESEEDYSDHEEFMGGKTYKKASSKKPLLAEEDEEWGGDSKEEHEHLVKVLSKKGSSKVSTRAKSDPLDKERGEIPAPNSKKSNDLHDFIVDDDDPIEDVEEEEEEEWMDEDQEPLPKPSKKTVCKYGSNCYRKNPEHLMQFYHPEI